MVTIPEAVEQLILHEPFLEEALARGLLNLSELARQIRPGLQLELKKKIETGAVVMALKRLKDRIEPLHHARTRFIRDLGDITVRSHLMEFSFQTSDSLLEKQQQLLMEIRKRRNSFVTMTQGVTELTMIFSSSLEKSVDRLFAGERVLARLPNLSAVTIRLPGKSVTTSGVFYTLLKQLAWQDINVVEVVSTLTELTLIVERQHVDQAFSALKSFLWK